MYQEIVNFWFEEIEPALWWKKDDNFDVLLVEPSYLLLESHATCCSDLCLEFTVTEVLRSIALTFAPVGIHEIVNRRPPRLRGAEISGGGTMPQWVTAIVFNRPLQIYQRLLCHDAFLFTPAPFELALPLLIGALRLLTLALTFALPTRVVRLIRRISLSIFGLSGGPRPLQARLVVLRDGYLAEVSFALCVCDTRVRRGIIWYNHPRAADECQGGCEGDESYRGETSCSH